MKIILLQDVKKIGNKGSVVDVSDGYARNLLIPKGLAKLADEKSIKKIQSEIEKTEQQENSTKLKLQNLADQLSDKTVVIEQKATPEGKLYAQLKENENLDTIRHSFEEVPEEAQISEGLPIKTTGEHQIKLNLGFGITTLLNLSVSNIDG